MRGAAIEACKRDRAEDVPATSASGSSVCRFDEVSLPFEETDVAVLLPKRFHSPACVRQALRCPPCVWWPLPSDVVQRMRGAGCLVAIPGFLSTWFKAEARCDRSLHAALSRAVELARSSLGSVDSIDPANAVLLAALCPVSEAEESSSEGGDSAAAVGSTGKRRRVGRAAAAAPHRLCVAAVCIATMQERVYRAHYEPEGKAMVSDTLSVDTSASSTEAAVASRSPSRSLPQGQQAHLIGDVWCTGTSFCGVQLFCVADRYRRRGLATALVEMARKVVCYGYEVPAEHVAFSEPTALGSAFAAWYSGRRDFLVY